MDKRTLINVINEILLTLGFKRKGNLWKLDSSEIVKYINIQKSQYSNLYYLYYGYILKNIKVDDNTNKYYKGFNSIIIKNGTKLDLLDLENDFKDEFRSEKLQDKIKKEVIDEFQKVNNESDILNDINNLPTKELVFLNIRKYFGLD